jgi:hypothetical protein
MHYQTYLFILKCICIKVTFIKEMFPSRWCLFVFNLKRTTYLPIHSSKKENVEIWMHDFQLLSLNVMICVACDIMVTTPHYMCGMMNQYSQWHYRDYKYLAKEIRFCKYSKESLNIKLISVWRNSFNVKYIQW